ncbi:MAG: ATP-binding protein, partial [Myxococcota bacterium]
RTVTLRAEGVRLSDDRIAILFSVDRTESVSEEVLRGVEAVRHTSALITMLDGDGHQVLWANPAALRWYGPAAGEETGWVGRFADEEEGRRALAELLGQGFLNLEARFRSHEGLRWHHVEARKTVDPVSGEPALLVHEQDIEGRKKIEDDLRRVRNELEERVQVRTRELAASRDFIETVVDAVDTLIIVAQGDQVTNANRRSLELLGSIKAKDVWEVTGLARHVEGDVHAVETEVATPEGPRTIMWTCTTSRGPATHTVLTGVDVTRQRAMQLRIQLADRLASLGTLSAGVAHELNNPLAVIRANLEALRDFSAATLEPSLAAGIQESISATDRAAAIVSDLKQYTRTGEQAESLVLSKLISRALRLASGSLRDVDVAIHLPDDLRVQGVEGLLTQLLLNLLVNSAQAMARGRGRIDVQASAVDEEVEIVIEDDGIGMSPEVARRAFDPFFTTKPLGEGTGLGLYVCQRIVSQHEGKIFFDPGRDCGTKVRIILPRGRAPGTPKGAPGPRAGPMERGRVLVVDDDRGILNAMTRLLREVEVHVEESGARALERIEREGEGYDVVLCDLMMPGMSGAELYREVERAHPDLARRFVFMSGGLHGLASMDEFLAQVPNPLLGKPIDVALLRSTLSEVLAQAS